MSDASPLPTPLTLPEKKFLREMALVSVKAAAEGAPSPAARHLAQVAGISLAPRLDAKRGAFVTLHLGGELRGCIGHIEGYLPLIETVVRNGRAAACEDPRFPPVTSAEVARLDLEISVLTPLQAVAGWQDIRLGEHGIVLARAGRQAVFLPQVATEQGWDLETTLAHLARKAGLAADEWRTGASYQVFAAEVF